MKNKFRRNALQTILVIGFAITNTNVFAQNENSPRALALSGCDVTLKDHFGVFQNPASLAFLTSTEAGMQINRNYVLRELDRQTFSLGVVFGKAGTLGIGISKFGYYLYEERKGGICWSRKFGNKFSASVQMGFQDVKIGEGLGHQGAPTIKIGILAKLSSQVIMGAVIDNPEHAKISEDQYIPSVFKLGMQLLISGKVSLYLQGSQTSSQPVNFSGGIEYQPGSEFFLRLGIKSSPLSPSFGFGFAKNHFRTDLSATWHPVLGVSPAISFTYIFSDKN